MTPLLKLNLGCSDRHMEGFLNVDLAAPADVIADLEGPWPWPDSSVDDVRAHDVAEHIGDCSHVQAWVCPACVCFRYGLALGERAGFDLIRRDVPAVFTGGLPEGDWPWPRRHALGRIHFMNELHRVLAPGGRATIEVPDALKGAGFFQDPTHKTAWCRNSLQYFGAGPGGEFAHNRLAAAYGITAKFRLVSEDYRCYADAMELVYKIIWVLEAVK